METFPYFIGESVATSIMRKITIRDVAKKCNRSIATVSRVFNPGEGAYVDEDTRRSILQAAEELGYFPSPAARSMKGKKTYRLSLLTSHSKDIMTSRYHTQLMKGILDGLAQSSYSLQINLLKDKEYSSLEDLLHEFSVDGLLILTWRIHPNIIKLIEACPENFPVMLFNDFIPSVKANFVYCNVELGMEMAAKYLIGKGRKKIAFLRGPTLIRFGKDQDAVSVPSIDSRDKFNGFKKAVEEAGFEIHSEWVRECANYNKDEGYRQTKVLLVEKNLPDAILCSNDELALGCLDALHEMKVSCPKEIAVMGFDGIETGAFSTPPLTTVEQLLDQMGLEGAQKLVEILEEKRRDPIHVGFVPKLLARKSA